MRGFVSFLLFAAFFFFMMRFGCGAHAGHGGNSGGHGSGPTEGASASSSIDPVCGMRVKGDTGYAKMYRGSQYRFCSRDCLDKFDASPDQYLARQAGSARPVDTMGHGGHPS